jgi:hypothetical protein
MRFINDEEGNPSLLEKLEVLGIFQALGGNID